MIKNKDKLTVDSSGQFILFRKGKDSENAIRNLRVKPQDFLNHLNLIRVFANASPFEHDMVSEDGKTGVISFTSMANRYAIDFSDGVILRKSNATQLDWISKDGDIIRPAGSPGDNNPVTLETVRQVCTLFALKAEESEEEENEFIISAQ